MTGIRSELSKSLSQLIATLEVGIPANPAKSEALELSLAKELSRYFRALSDALPWEKIEALYNRNVQESLREAAPLGFGDIFDPILQAFQTQLTAILQGHAINVYLKGSAEVTSWGRTMGGFPKLYEGPPMQEAINYANTRSAQMVTNMDKVTQDRLAQVVGDAIENKRGVDGLARDIRLAFDDMTTSRSQMIARTETADSLEAAFMDRSKAMGVTGKEVVTGDPCEICQAFEEEGVVPIDHEYVYDGKSYGERPPFHPNCVCALAPVMLET